MEPEPEATPESEPESGPAQAEGLPALDLDGLRSLWPAVLDTVRSQNAMLATVLEGANPVDVAFGELRLAFAESAAFFKRNAERASNRETLSTAVRTVTGTPLRLVYELRADEETTEAAESALSDEELVARVLAEFDAEELPPDPPEEAH